MNQKQKDTRGGGGGGGGEAGAGDNAGWCSMRRGKQQARGSKANNKHLSAGKHPAENHDADKHDPWRPIRQDTRRDDLAGGDAPSILASEHNG
jgi:hypothetical protein